MYKYFRKWDSGMELPSSPALSEFCLGIPSYSWQLLSCLDLSQPTLPCFIIFILVALLWTYGSDLMMSSLDCEQMQQGPSVFSMCWFYLRVIICSQWKWLGLGVTAQWLQCSLFWNQSQCCKFPCLLFIPCTSISKVRSFHSDQKSLGLMLTLVNPEERLLSD